MHERMKEKAQQSLSIPTTKTPTKSRVKSWRRLSMAFFHLQTSKTHSRNNIEGMQNRTLSSLVLRVYYYCLLCVWQHEKHSMSYKEKNNRWYCSWVWRRDASSQESTVKVTNKTPNRSLHHWFHVKLSSWKTTLQQNSIAFGFPRSCLL
jgi:hypothetical protein